jgi:uncharacterized membrane protein YfcA
MKTSNLSIILMIAAMLLSFTGCFLCHYVVDFTIIAILVMVIVLLLLTSFVLMVTSTKDSYINFTPRHWRKKILILIPLVFILSSCTTTTRVCNYRNGNTKIVNKTTNSYSQYVRNQW